MNNDLFELAKKDYAAVKKLMPHKSSDEYFLSIVCYHYQQAIEKLLKYLINMCGSKYPATHDIALLYNKCENLGVVLPSELGLMATTLTDWEVKTRCSVNIVATIQQLECAEKIYNSLLEIINKRSVDTNENKNETTAKIKCFDQE